MSLHNPYQQTSKAVQCPRCLIHLERNINSQAIPEHHCVVPTVAKDFAPIPEIIGRNILNEDPVHHPRHYTAHPSGVECITITRHMGFNLGNAIKYIWRAEEKGNSIQDLEKAMWYLHDEIALRRKEGKV